MAAPILDAAQQECRPVGKEGRPRVKNSVGGVRPVFDRQDRVIRVAVKNVVVRIGHFQRSYSSVCKIWSASRISNSDIRKASVDSAPWFWLRRVRISPSRQPPVVG